MGWTGLGSGWIAKGVWFSFLYFYFSFLFLIQTNLNSNYTQIIKTLHQHVCNKHFNPKINFNYLWNKI